jgi:hypothetical protein
MKTEANSGQENRRGKRPYLWCFLATVLTASAISLSLRFGVDPHPAALPEVLCLSPARLSKLPIYELNLLCATGLSAGGEPDIKHCKTIIDSWVQHVRSETEHHRYRYERNPAEFENSEGFFKMLMVAVVLAEDCRVHYDGLRKAGPESSTVSVRFFSDPKSVFLHGLLGSERQGTCSSLPVLYVAVGRELGYPLKLVTTKGHMFVRWEGAGERFNVEVTGDHGINRFSDDYYRHWPFEISPAEEQAEGYLESLTAPQELAVFLSIRGMCLRDLGRLAEAADAFAAAARLAPECRSYRQMCASLQAKSASNQANRTPIATRL